MRISVIIPTYNEHDVLGNCLESLEKESIKDFEVIVVDDGSNDGTRALIKRLIKNFRNLSLVESSHKGAGAARNLGAQKAKGRILVFVDADMTFDVDFLKNLIKPIESGRAKGVFSKEEYVANWSNVWSKCWNINEGWEEKRRHPKNFPDEQPVFRAILQSEFVKVGGFTPGGYDDDWSLSRKLGYKAVNAPGAIFYHKNPSRLSEIYNHAKWVGKRKYKLGLLGYFIALLRSSLPVSLIPGVTKSINNRRKEFIVFKVVYDFGIFVGVCEYLLTGRKSK